MDTPSNESGIYISGGQMAAPVVGRILGEVLPYLGVQPQYSEAEENTSTAPCRRSPAKRQRKR